MAHRLATAQSVAVRAQTATPISHMYQCRCVRCGTTLRLEAPVPSEKVNIQATYAPMPTLAVAVALTLDPNAPEKVSMQATYVGKHSSHAAACTVQCVCQCTLTMHAHAACSG
jgi:hypothetical protein